MKVTFKSEEKFLSEGFKSDYPHWYKGTKKAPDATSFSTRARFTVNHEL